MKELSMRRRIFLLMRDGVWRTPREIRAALGLSEDASGVTAKIRDLRKEEFGSHQVPIRHRAGEPQQVHEYQLIENPRAREIVEEWRAKRGKTGPKITAPKMKPTMPAQPEATEQGTLLPADDLVLPAHKRM